MTTLNSLVHNIEGNWDQIKGELKTRWGKLTDDDITKIAGSYDELIGKLKDIYGYSEDEIEDKLNTFLDKLKLNNTKEAVKEMQDKISQNVEKAWAVFKNKADEIQDGIYCYVKVNPFRAVSVASVAVILSVLAFKFFRKDK